MRCDDVRARLDDYLDGALRPGERRVVVAHLDDCPSCRAELDELQGLLRRLGSLADEIEPPRDLWPEIASRLAAPVVVAGRFGPAARRWLAVAASVAAALAALLLAYSSGRQQGSAGTVAAREATPLAVPAALNDTGFAGAEAEFRAARDRLLAALADRRDTMSPETRQIVDDNLRVIDEAIERISAALVDDPLNPRLANQLASAYRRQIELLQRASRLPAET